MLRYVAIPAVCLAVAIGVGLARTARADGLTAGQLAQVTAAKTDLRKVRELISSQDYDEARDTLQAVEESLKDSELPDTDPRVRELRIAIETYHRRIDVATGKVKPAAQTASPAGRRGKRPVVMKAEQPEGPIRFDRDIAPILAANCLGCHNPKKKSSKLDLSTYASFRKGGKRGPAFEPGDPDDSLVVKFLRGIEQPKMPKGGQFLEEDAIERVEDWIKAGARVGAASPTAPINTIIPSEDQVQRERIARMSDRELTSFHEQLAESHWSQVTKKPAATASNTTFLVYSSSSSAPAEQILHWADRALAEVRSRLGRSSRAHKAIASRGSKGSSGPVWRGRLTIYVFGDRPGYSEFVRSVEGQADVSAKDQGHYHLGIDEPLIVIHDRSDEEGDRNLPALITETVAGAYMAATASGRLPQWFIVGFSAALGAQKDPRARTYKDWKASAFRKLHDDWRAVAGAVLDNRADWDEDRDLAFSLVEFLETQRPQFKNLIRALSARGSHPDAALKAAFGVTRDQLIRAWGQYVQRNYSRLRGSPG